jgi:UDP-glucose 4-epimerase
MKNILVTGASGFFGGILKRRLLVEGYAVTNIDLVPDPDQHPALTSIQGDIRDTTQLETLFANGSFSAVFHAAAMLAHDQIDDNALWTSNVDGTRNIAEAVGTEPQIILLETKLLKLLPDGMTYRRIKAGPTMEVGVIARVR